MRDKQQRLTVSTTTVDFLFFSHGRHACPDRFLVVGDW